MKHGFGEFRWASGGHYKGFYVKDQKAGFGEMIWADGSQYKGQWENGVQNGLGLMIFANGLKKAGTFKDNVLVELVDEGSIAKQDQRREILPAEFKSALTDFITERNPDEDQTNYLKKELKKNQVEEKTQPNTLLIMQEAANAPWGGKTDFTKSMFIDKVKAKDVETQYEPPSSTLVQQKSSLK